MSGLRKRPQGSKASVGIHGARIVEAVASRYGLTVADLKCTHISRTTYVPRQHAMSDLRAADYTEAAIADFFGRERSTISHADARHLARIAWAEVLLAIIPDDPCLAVAA